MSVKVIRKNPKAIQQVKDNMKKLRNKAVYVGLPAGTDGELVMRGAVHQFGSKKRNIPARPWLDKGAEQGAPKYKKLAKNKVSSVVTGDLSVNDYYKTLGEISVAEVRKYLRNGDFVPLSAATIERKGSSKPLIDTGQLRNSVTYEVK